MKKKLKGLLALLMAIAMVVPMAVPAMGAISEEKYEEVKDDANYMEAYISKDEKPSSEAYYDNEYVCVGEAVKDQFYDWYLANYNENLYFTDGWEIFGRTPDGGYDYQNTKIVDYDYVVTEADIKAYGAVGEDGTYYEPAIKSVIDSYDFTLPVYNDSGVQIDTIIVNMHSMNKELIIPDGYAGYLLYGSRYDSYYDETELNSAFVADHDDIWTEMEIMTCFSYEPLKLVLTKKMPYYLELSYFDSQIIYLEPGEDLSKNAELKDILSGYEYYDGTAIDMDDIQWQYWRVNYCGHSSPLPSDIEATMENGKALTVEQYTNSRKGIYHRGYADTYYFGANYMGLSVYDVKTISYYVPIYDYQGEYYDDLYIDKGYSLYDDYEIEAYGELEECNTWRFEYRGVDYGQVKYYKDIWEIAFKDGLYNYDDAKLYAVCTNHDYDYENGVVVAQPTVDKKGSTKYKCKNCTATIVVEDIDKIPTIESVTLGTTTYTYTGSAFTPSVTVKAKVNGVLKTLTKDVDYTVSYSNNKNPGLATVTVTGKGKYAGTKTAQFTIKPAQVKNLKAEPGIEQITLSWDAVPGATGYAVYATAEEGDYVYIGATSKTSFVEKGLPNGTEFDYKVAAYVKTANGNVFGPYSNSIKEGSKIRLESVTLSRTSFVYTGEYIKPVATVKGYDVTGRLVVLTNWTDYKIDYKNFKAPGIATMTITGRGNYYGTLTINFTITPTWVQNVKQVVASTTDKEIGLTWDSVVGVTGYEVYRSTEKLGTYSLVGSTQTNSFVTKNLEAGKSYFYKVRAYKTVDGKRIYGNYSNILKATTRTVPPSKVMGAITLNTNNISWYYSPGAAGYEVYLSTASKFIGSKIETTTPAVRSVTIPGLTAGKYYYVRVRAYTTTATGAKMYTEFTTPLAFKAR